jgi:glycosyltransferase involved in cell wall biosynthesis
MGEPVPHRPAKRILLVSAEALFFTSHWMHFALAARERGYDVHVATPDGRGLDKILSSGLQWHRIVMRRGLNVLREVVSAPDLVFLYRRLRPDLIHHIAVKAVLYGTVAASMTRVPALLNAFPGLGYLFDDEQARSPMGRALRFGFSRSLRHPRMRVSFENDENRRVFVDRGWVRDEATVMIPGAGIDPLDYRPAGAEPAGPPLVVMAARLLFSKGATDFVDAARVLAGRGVRARFALIGEPDPDNPDTITTGQLEEWKKEGVVEIWGRRNDMPDVLREAAVFCLPTFYREGIPKVLMEAGATALPSVTTNTAGCRDIIVHEETGLLVEPRDVAGLAAALQRLIDDPALRRRLGLQARERVLAHFTAAHTTATTLRIYEELIGAP